MRISKPRDWPFMSELERDAWRLETSKKIEKSKKDFEKYLKEQEINQIKNELEKGGGE